MQIVPRQLRKLAVGQEFRLHVAGCGIERRFIEIDNAIEESRRTMKSLRIMRSASMGAPLSPVARKFGKLIRSHPWDGLWRPNAEITVAPYTLMLFACSLPTTSL